MFKWHPKLKTFKNRLLEMRCVQIVTIEMKRRALLPVVDDKVKAQGCMKQIQAMQARIGGRMTPHAKPVRSCPQDLFHRVQRTKAFMHLGGCKHMVNSAHLV